MCYWHSLTLLLIILVSLFSDCSNNTVCGQDVLQWIWLCWDRNLGWDVLHNLRWIGHWGIKETYTRNVKFINFFLYSDFIDFLNVHWIVLKCRLIATTVLSAISLASSIVAVTLTILGGVSYHSCYSYYNYYCEF